MNIQPHEYKPIVMRYLNGEATHEEEAMIDAFIKQGEEQAALFNQWMEEWEANIFSTPAPAVDQAWQHLQNAIDHAEDEETSPAHTAATPSDSTPHIGRTVHMQWWHKAVAAAAIIVIIGCAAIWSFSGSTATQTYLCSAPAGSKTQVTLPDGSKVWLNGGSSLAYTNQFNNDNRRVELHGGAYFEVQKHQGKPFTVHTQGYDVYFARRLGEDLGVEINFVSTEAANRIEYLQTGKVDVILANFTVTPERAEEVDFALPYMNVALGVISPDSNVITTLDNWNADDQMIVISGTTAETYLEKNNPEIKLQKYDAYAEAKTAFENGNGVAWANDNTEVIAFAIENPGYTVGIPSLGNADTIAPAVTKDNSTLLNWLNDEIKALGNENFFHADYEATLLDTYGKDYEDTLVVEGGVTATAAEEAPVVEENGATNTTPPRLSADSSSKKPPTSTSSSDAPSIPLTKTPICPSTSTSR